MSVKECDKLKSCPFCGGYPEARVLRPLWEGQSSEFVISCETDRRTHEAEVYAPNQDAAIAAWNRRA